MNYQQRQRRSFLFLQGPHGAFFPRLGTALRRIGHDIHRINFNGGDRATWPDGVNFSGLESGWPAFIAQFLETRQITDLVIYGDCRPKHATAVAAARRAGIAVHVFEEGYVRPDWVTLERGGVNGYSTLPRDPAWYLAQALGLPPVPSHPPIPAYAAVRGWGAFFYYAEVVLQFWRFPFHRTHRTRDPVLEGLSFLWRISSRRRERERAATAERNLAGADYMLFPLQLDSDYQIRLHSPFPDLRSAITVVLNSFAREAPPAMRLAIKEHPLDGGLINWRRVVDDVARAAGVADRIDFLEHGDLLQLIRNARGMVTVNSTSGTLALAEGLPVVVMGTAVYDVPGITHQGGLDSFWRAPQPPEPATFDAFYRVLVDRCLLHGAFLSRTGSDAMIQAAVLRLTRSEQLAASPVPVLVPALSAR